MAGQSNQTVHVTYPLSHGAISPGEGFTRMTMPLNPAGYPEGVHTGGLFLSPDGLSVWKPLDCLPYQNCECRVPTAEADVLEQLAGQPCFPRNWVTVLQRGREWLVRPRFKVYGQDLPMESLTHAQVLLIEQAVRTLNECHWEISDDLVVAQGEDGEPFLLDLSNAHHRGTPNQAWPADDTARVWAFMQRAGQADLASLRSQGQSVYHAAPSGSRSRHPHIYVADQPLSDEALLDLCQLASTVRGRRRTDGLDDLEQPSGTLPFLQTHALLPEAVQAAFRLEWAYSPLQYQP